MNKVTSSDQNFIESASNKGRLNNLILSPSSISHFECPRKWYLKYLSNIEMESFNSSVIGEKAHDILNDFMELNASFRNYKGLKTLCAQTCRKHSKAVGHSEIQAEKFKKYVTKKCLKIFKVINPQEITPIFLEHKIEGAISGVTGQGIVDIVFEEKGQIYIADYKTSNFKQQYVHSAIRQVVFYNYILNYKNAKGSILYLGQNHKRYDFEITNQMTEEMLSSFELTKSEILKRGSDIQNYEANPSGSCLGCKYSKAESVCSEGHELTLQIKSKSV